MTTEDSKVYLVQEGTLPDTISIRESAVAITDVTAYTQAKLPTSGLAPGNYIVYAIDSSNNISEASRLITIETPVHTSTLQNNTDISVRYHPDSEIITAFSSKEINYFVSTLLNTL